MQGRESSHRPAPEIPVHCQATPPTPGIGTRNRQSRWPADKSRRRRYPAQAEAVPQRQALPEPGIEIPDDQLPQMPAAVISKEGRPPGRPPGKGFSGLCPGGQTNLPPIRPVQVQPESRIVRIPHPAAPERYFPAKSAFLMFRTGQTVGCKRHERGQRLCLYRSETINQFQLPGREDIPLRRAVIQQRCHLIRSQEPGGEQTAPGQVIDTERMRAVVRKPLRQRNIQRLDIRLPGQGQDFFHGRFQAGRFRLCQDRERKGQQPPKQVPPSFHHDIHFCHENKPEELAGANTF